LSARVTVTFMTVAVLWSIWASESVVIWYDTLQIYQKASVVDWLSLIIGFSTITFVGGVAYYSSIRIDFSYIKQSLNMIPITCLSLLVLAFNQLTLEQFWNEKLSQNAIESIFHQTLNADDLERQTAGYYDDLLQANNAFGAQGQTPEVALYAKAFEKTGIVQLSDAPIHRRLAPNTRVTFQGVDFDTNQWGMRDDSYDKLPPRNTTRIAMSGASIEMGVRVQKELTFETLVERRFNQSGADVGKVEILNFSMYGWEIAQQAHFIKSELIDFKPQYLLIFHHYEDWGLLKGSIERLQSIGYKHEVFNEPYRRMQQSRGRLAVLNPLELDIVNGLHADIYQTCEENGIQPVLVMMPSLKPIREFRERDDRLNQISTQASAIGFDVIDLRSAYQGYDPATLRVSNNDSHPNAQGHRLLADKLEPILRELILQKN